MTAKPLTAYRPREPFEHHAAFVTDGIGSRHREQEQVELLDHEAEHDNGNASSDPGQEGALVRGMIAVA
jgi:hypothetical protein